MFIETSKERPLFKKKWHCSEEGGMQQYDIQPAQLDIQMTICNAQA